MHSNSSRRGRHRRRRVHRQPSAQRRRLRQRGRRPRAASPARASPTNTADENGGGILIQSGDIRMRDIDVLRNVRGLDRRGRRRHRVRGGQARQRRRVGGDHELAHPRQHARRTTAAASTAAATGRSTSPRRRSPGTPRSWAAGSTTSATPRSMSRAARFGGNFAEGGGGLFTDGDGETTVENTTVSGNRAGQFGGGLLVSSRLVIRNSTVASNNAASGGGINNGGGDLVGDGTVFLANTIVANSPTGGNCMGTMTSRGGNVDSGDSCLFRELSDQPGTDPLLGPLAENGGPTRTHALLAGSPAQDRADCTVVDPCPAVDQRDVARPLFAGFDAGAYESELPPAGGGGPAAVRRTVRATRPRRLRQLGLRGNAGVQLRRRLDPEGQVAARRQSAGARPLHPAAGPARLHPLRREAAPALVVGNGRPRPRGASPRRGLERGRRQLDQSAQDLRRGRDRPVRDRPPGVGRARPGPRDVRAWRLRLPHPRRRGGRDRRAVAAREREGRRPASRARARLRPPGRAAARERVLDDAAEPARRQRQLGQPGEPGEQLRDRLDAEGEVPARLQRARARSLPAPDAARAVHEHRVRDAAAGGVVGKGGANDRGASGSDPTGARTG